MSTETAPTLSPQEAIKDAYEDTVDVFDLVDDLSLKSMTINELKSSNIKSLTRIKNNNSSMQNNSKGFDIF